MAATASNVVFDDLFTISATDKDGKKFDRGGVSRLRMMALGLTSSNSPVSRLFAHSSNYDMELTLDFNAELYPLKSGESFSLVLASSLVRGVEGGAVNGTEVDDEKDTHIWRPDGKGRRGLEEDYEYVMYGRVRSAF